MSLEEQLRPMKAVTQIATSSGDEVLCTSQDIEETARLTRLTTAFVETETLVRSLKLGSVHQIITASTKDDKTSYSVQSQRIKSGEDEGDELLGEETEILLSTTVSESLQGALVADGVVRETTKHIL